MAMLYKALAVVRNVIQVIVICGDNQRLAHAIRTESTQTNIATVVIDKLPSMSDMMAACDLLVTKAGGLTTYEAIARRLPMAIDMISELMPQEAGTAAILIEAKLAVSIATPDDIVALAERLQVRERRAELPPLPTQHNLDRTNSVYDIAKLILAS